jgi:hypothetical protein
MRGPIADVETQRACWAWYREGQQPAGSTDGCKGDPCP